MKTIENPTVRLYHVPSFGKGPLKGPGTIPPQSTVDVTDEYFDRLTQIRQWKSRLDGTKIKHPEGAAGLLEQRILARRKGRKSKSRESAAESRAQALEAKVADLELRLEALTKASSAGGGGEGGGGNEPEGGTKKRR